LLSHLDLFSGVGGFALAARWAGFRTIAFCEKDKFCQQVLAKNFPSVPIHDDIKTFHWRKNETHGEKIDVLTAGFP
jgi:DNA (cytosine-5)-methyltransferase 1